MTSRQPRLSSQDRRRKIHRPRSETPVEDFDASQPAKRRRLGGEEVSSGEEGSSDEAGPPVPSSFTVLFGSAEIPQRFHRHNLSSTETSCPKTSASRAPSAPLQSPSSLLSLRASAPSVQGGMGTLTRLQTLKSNRGACFVLKCPNRSKGAQDALNQRLEDEARAYEALWSAEVPDERRPNIPKYFGYFRRAEEEPERAEQSCGALLLEDVGDAPSSAEELSLPDKLSLLISIAKLHSLGFEHGDIALRNFAISTTSLRPPSLIDFSQTTEHKCPRLRCAEVFTALKVLGVSSVQDQEGSREAGELLDRLRQEWWDCERADPA
ncbi:hypothetical protein JCM5296_001604 [Sporobolomyces johnsonii]